MEGSSVLTTVAMESFDPDFFFPKNTVLDAELPARLSIKMTGDKKKKEKKRKANANG